MADKSGIEWTDATWNPVIGCSKVSPGCAHCYAEELHRTRFDGQHGYPPFRPWSPDNASENVVLRPDRLDQPLRWTKPRMVFVNSMSDLFHPEVPDEFIGQVLNTIYFAQDHTFQILTKRPERMRDCLERYYSPDGLDGTGNPTLLPSSGYRAAIDNGRRVLHNLWLGTSIENRRFVDRADALRETPAAVRFISAEPLLGPLIHDAKSDGDMDYEDMFSDGSEAPELDMFGIDWLIVGGESGPKHRPIAEDWVHRLMWAAHFHGAHFFFKQWGGRTPKANGRELNGRTYDEMPEVNR